jgi:hypothetical protein
LRGSRSALNFDAAAERAQIKFVGGTPKKLRNFTVKPREKIVQKNSACFRTFPSPLRLSVFSLTTPALFFFEIVFDIAYGFELLQFVVLYRPAVPLFQLHKQVDKIERIRADIGQDIRFATESRLVELKLICNSLLDFFKHKRTLS